MVNIARALLKKEGAHVVVAGTLSKGVEELSAASFDAMITERELPDGDGLEFLTKAKETTSNKDLPVIMFTAITDAQEIKKSLEGGAKGYIVKPFTPNNFMKQVTKVLGA
jgi:DNA-binding response OmpR family regulator